MLLLTLLMMSSLEFCISKWSFSPATLLRTLSIVLGEKSMRQVSFRRYRFIQAKLLSPLSLILWYVGFLCLLIIMNMLSLYCILWTTPAMQNIVLALGSEWSTISICFTWLTELLWSATILFCGILKIRIVSFKKFMLSFSLSVIYVMFHVADSIWD